jgi:hypothetical protein
MKKLNVSAQVLVFFVFSPWKGKIFIARGKAPGSKKAHPPSPHAGRAREGCLFFVNQGLCPWLHI